MRQGRLDAAIDEYQRIGLEHPTDWNGANTLGDLLVRAGQIDKAIVQYTRIADHLAREGFFPKAVALYKKILKFNPDNEYALIQTGEITARQGLLAAAKAHLVRVVERRLALGDDHGAAEMRARIGLLDPADLEARVAGARATVEMGQPVDGARLLVTIGLEAQGRGRPDMTFDLLSEAATLAPDDEDVQGHVTAMRFDLVQQALERGDLAAAREHLSSVAIGSDPERQLLAAELDLRSHEYGSGGEILRHLLVDAPELGERVRDLAHRLAAVDAEAAFACADSLAADAIAHEDWSEAARALLDFLTQTPRHIPALMRLIEVSIDGGALDRLHAAQAQLADAYLESGRGDEARVIAEDLAMSAPWERIHVDRWRRALALVGEPDPDRVIADKVSGANAEADAQPVPPDDPQQPTDPRFQLSASAIDVQAILSGDLDDAASRVMHLDQVEVVEVDLSAAIEGLTEGEDNGAGGDMEEIPKDPRGLDGVFEDFRSEVSRQDSADTAGQHIKLAITYQDMGLVDEAIGALQAAARSPRYRFEAASMLGRLLLQRGKLSDAIEWFERAAEAPAATADDGRALLYDLAKALEASGEVARALAVYLEIQSDMSGYRDVSARVGHLSRLQSQG